MICSLISFFEVFGRGTRRTPPGPDLEAYACRCFPKVVLLLPSMDLLFVVAKQT